MPDNNLPLHLRVNPPTGYVARILEHYPGWQQWEIDNRQGRNIEGFIYTVINSTETACKIGFSQAPEIRMRHVIASTQYLPKHIGNRPYLWKGYILRPGLMADELDTHSMFERWQLKGLSQKVEANTEWYLMDSPAGEWVRSQL